MGITLFVPVVLTLTLVGNEGALGTIQAGIAVVSAAVLYWIGRQVKKDIRKHVFSISAILSVSAALVLLLDYDICGAIGYLGLSGLAFACTLATYNHIQYENIEFEEGRSGMHRYAYLLDQEIFLVIGRFSGLAPICIAYALGGLGGMLRTAAIVCAAASVALWSTYRRLSAPQQSLKMSSRN